MTHQRSQGNEGRSGNPDLIAGLSIGLGSLLSVALMAQHPSISARGTAAAIAEMSREAALNGFVHGALIAIMGGLLFGFVGFASHLGWHSARVRIGMIAHAVGVLFLMGAALVSGFMIPDLAQRYAGSSTEEMEAFTHLLRLCHQANQVLAKMAVMAMSVAIVSWSLVMVRRAASARVVGVLGLAVGTLPIVGLLAGHLPLHVHGMGAVVAAQAVWSVSIAAWLLRRVHSR